MIVIWLVASLLLSLGQTAEITTIAENRKTLLNINYSDSLQLVFRGDFNVSQQM